MPCPRYLYRVCSWLCSHVNAALEYLDALNLILVCSGGVQVNPGPMSDPQAKRFNEMFKLLHEINTRYVRID